MNAVRLVKCAAVCVLAALLIPLPAVSVLADPGESDRSTLTVGLLSEPPSLNPLVVTSGESRDIVWRLFLKLLDEQPDYISFTPRLAERWTFSPDSLSITFFLRPDVRWTDGRPVTARDVRFTWELHVDTLVAWPGRHIKQHVRDVVVVDEHTVRFDFSRRYPYQLMDANDGVILPEHLLGGVPRDKLRTHEFGRLPVGNGPFKLSRWEPEQYIQLEKNVDYYEPGKPFLEKIVFKFVPDMVNLMTQLGKGEIDLLESIPSDHLSVLTERRPQIKIYTYPSRDYWYIAWNTGRDLFSTADTRRALTGAIDRSEIISTLWRDMAQLCTSPIHPNLWAYDGNSTAIPFDPAAARAGLEKLGWSDSDGDGYLDREGKRFEFEMITNSSNQLRVDITTMAEAYLKRVGVKVNIRTMEFQAVVQKLLSSDFDSCVFGWGTATKPDITSHWHSSAVPRSGMNISQYSNPAVDDLIERARVELDQERAAELWGEAQRIIYEDQPFTFLLIPHEVNALDGRFCNVRPNAISFFYNVRDWRLAPDCPR
jgi:peptide/nickel transport system substrate-binding protein